MGTIFVSAILILIVAAIIVYMVKAKRSGKHPSCGGNCGSCKACHHANNHNVLKSVKTT
ncbi:MAG: FeoB-associated Cys-rich membrane protein [Treponema sp.]|nr:FeoB-associated Cys-rich membrane protein [Treponema sp.]